MSRGGALVFQGEGLWYVSKQPLKDNTVQLREKAPASSFPNQPSSFITLSFPSASPPPLPSPSLSPPSAYCDVPSHLQCHSWMVKESERYGEKWSKKWAQEYALKRVLSELPSILSDHARPVDTQLFQTWRDFLALFLAEGIHK